MKCFIIPPRHGEEQSNWESNRFSAHAAFVKLIFFSEKHFYKPLSFFLVVIFSPYRFTSHFIALLSRPPSLLSLI